MQYRFRTLLIVLALAPPALAGTWWYLSRLLADGALVGAGAVFVGTATLGAVAMFVLVVIAKLLDAVDRPHRR
jgi:hypothetical protein